jgi:arylsulfatase A-like enzyme
MDMHGPYLPPHEYLPDSYESGDFLSYFDFLRLAGKGRLADAALHGQLRNLRDRYAGELQHTDRQLGLFFEELRARGRWEETLIWVVSDHGEAFGEHDWAGHSVGLWPTLTQVPLMVRPPHSWNIAPRTVHAPVSTRDILPTTLSMLNLPDPGNVVGRDLSSLINGGAEDERRVVYSANTRDGRRTYSAVRGWWRLEAALDVEGRIVDHALYGLAESADEDEDVSALHPEVAAEFVSDLEARLIEEARWNLDTSDVEIDALTRERLRSLGYAD